MADSEQQHRTILVVEDEAFVRLHAVEIVRDEGLPTLEAADALEALDLLKIHPEVAVLFTDIDMPGGMDGMELVERVHKQLPTVQLVLTSGRARPSADEIPDSGTFLAKPYSAADLTSVLREMLARNGSA